MAIIGRGDIAKEIPDREDFIFYANGCSNRNELTRGARSKEFNEVYNQHNTQQMFVYFSSLSIYYSNSDYTQHKLMMEKTIQIWFKNYCIFRIGNIDWGDNPNTLINHLKRDSSSVQETYRYILNKEEFKHWTGMIPQKGQHIMNVTGKLTWVPDLVNFFKEYKSYQLNGHNHNL